MKFLRAVSLPAVLMLLCSCSLFSKSAPQDAKFPTNVSPPPPQEYKKDGLVFNIVADSQLNRYKNSPHTLLLCLYQLKDPNGFNQLADDAGSLAKLLECGKFDASVVYAKRVIVQPGQTLTEKRDRAEGARFVAIAAGYYGTGNEKMTHLTPLSSKSPSTVSIELGSLEISGVMVK